MDARGEAIGAGRARRPSSADARRAAAAREAMARMEEVMLSHAGAAGEFSIILDAPLPASRDRYRRNTNPNPSPIPIPSSRAAPTTTGQRPHSAAGDARFRGGNKNGVGGYDEVPARLRRDSSAPADIGNVGGGREEAYGEAQRRPAAASVRRTRRENGVYGGEEEEEAPLRLAAPGGRRPSRHGAAVVRDAVAPPDEETREEEEEAAAALRPHSWRSRRDNNGEAPAPGIVADTSAVAGNGSGRFRKEEEESIGRWSSRGSEDSGGEEKEKVAPLPNPLAAVVTDSRSRSNSPAISRNGVDSAAATRTPSTGRPTFAPPKPASVRPAPPPIQSVEFPNGTPTQRRGIYPDPIFAQSTRSRDSRDSSTLTEELEMLQDENVNLLEKLELAEERFIQSEARSRELEKQVANLGDGLSMEVKLMKRREEMLVKKEQEIRKALRSKDGKSEEIAALQQQLQSARDDVTSAVEKLKEAESETKALHLMTHRMILSKEEMEEVVLKRCWLARYWGLAVQYGIYPDISISKHEYWSSFAPLPFEYVTSAGQRAKEGSSRSGTNGLEGTDKLVHDLTASAGEGNIESMLSVEKGLRELASLKVEDAVLIALAQHRRPNLVQPADSDIKSPGDQKFTEAFDLSQEEVEDVLFKQAWLIYFWRRAKTHGVEEDIAEERLQMWIDRLGQQPTSHDAVDVEQGLIELRKLSIEQLLWEASRREVDNTQNEAADGDDLS